ncbi:MAG: hypothetical protein A2W34_04035 [Chloroflexi bacterium RBG_16_64_32]|nr:MAG: hypothetical protein A2W34_04035 [Chloroflexi bacterium RBG_16_64_32]
MAKTVRVLRRAKNLQQLTEQFEAIKSGVAGDTNFGAAAALYLCEHALPELVAELKSLRREIQQTRRDLQAQRRTEESLAEKVQRLGQTGAAS